MMSQISEMSAMSQNFNDWFETKLLPAVQKACGKEKCVTVMDNASFHQTRPDYVCANTARSDDMISSILEMEKIQGKLGARGFYEQLRRDELEKLSKGHLVKTFQELVRQVPFEVFF